MLVSPICSSCIDAFSKDLYIEWKWSFEFPYDSPHVNPFEYWGWENGIIHFLESKDFKNEYRVIFTLKIIIKKQPSYPSLLNFEGKIEFDL